MKRTRGNKEEKRGRPPKKIKLDNYGPGEKPLSAKLERFCQEYLVDLNISAAAKRAGYKTSTASMYIYELVKRQDVQERIAYLQDQRARRLEISVDRVLRELIAIGLFNPKDLYWPDGTMKEISSLTREEAACITGMDVVVTKSQEDGTPIVTTKKIRFDGKQAALIQVGKHLGMFNERPNFIDPLLYELREKKASLDHMDEKDLIALQKLMRKAIDGSVRLPADTDYEPSGSGNGARREESETLH